MFVHWVMLGCTPQPSVAPEDPGPPPTDELVEEESRTAIQASAGGPGARVRAPIAQDTGADTGADTGLVPTGDTGAEEVVPLVARLTVDVDEGEYPLVVTFDATGSDLGTGLVRYEWDFDDGTEVRGDARQVHTYIGRGDFDVRLTLVDEGTGEVSLEEITIEVDEPDCPREESPEHWATLSRRLDELSGIASSRRAPGLYWLNQDNDDDLLVVDSDGETISEHDLPSEEDLEDIEVVVDPQTGVSMLFVADIGDNDLVRDEIEVWVAEEPDPWHDSDIEPLKMELRYPDGAHDAETLLVDPLTLDVFIVTKSGEDEQTVYVKRAPHDDEGPFELEDVGEFDELDLRATGGAVSADGSRIIIRDYSDTAILFFRDGYEAFEDAFEHDPCRVDIADDSRGEGVTFTNDGRGIVTINEGVGELHYIEL